MHIFCETSGILQSSRQREKELVATKGEKCLVATYIEDETEHTRSRLRSFVSMYSLYLRSAFRVCILLHFVFLAGPHFAMSHSLIIMNLFCFMSVLAHSKFPQN